MGRLDDLRDRAYKVIERTNGKLAEVARRWNDELGRPFASAEELADRRAFKAGYRPSGASPIPSSSAKPMTGEPAPVILYHLDKHRLELGRLLLVLDEAKIPYRVMNLEGDPATQAAVRRDGGGRKLPLVFVAGECVGGREELNALDKSGELKKKVWG